MRQLGFNWVLLFAVILVFMPEAQAQSNDLVGYGFSATVLASSPSGYGLKPRVDTETVPYPTGARGVWAICVIDSYNTDYRGSNDWDLSWGCNWEFNENRTVTFTLNTWSGDNGYVTAYGILLDRAYFDLEVESYRMYDNNVVTIDMSDYDIPLISVPRYNTNGANQYGFTSSGSLGGELTFQTLDGGGSDLYVSFINIKRSYGSSATLDVKSGSGRGSRQVDLFEQPLTRYNGVLNALVIPSLITMWSEDNGLSAYLTDIRTPFTSNSLVARITGVTETDNSSSRVEWMFITLNVPPQ
jgi:hypothetical protein